MACSDWELLPLAVLAAPRPGRAAAGEPVRHRWRRLRHPADLAVLVVREDAYAVADASPFFTSDRTAVRATMRLGFGFPHESAVVRIRRAAAV